jgi:hypothetical protein
MIMALTPCYDAHAASADPFSERSALCFSVKKKLLGARFRFDSNSQALLQLVHLAYDGLPQQELPMTTPEFSVELRLLPRLVTRGIVEPPRVKMQSGAGLLCGIMDDSNYVVLAPEQGRALIVASQDMLSHPYHLRYELIEFAVFTLATRGLGLIPLHAACVGHEGRGMLLLGSSGSGKSTLALHSLLHGLDFLAEDAVFVQPQSLLATGVANYLHVQADALRFIDKERVKRWIGDAPVIRRRSGVEKFEADLRTGHGRLAAAPLELVGAVFVSSQAAEDPAHLLKPVPKSQVATRLQADQPYAVGQSGWQDFERRMMGRSIYELRRGRHPRASVDALLPLLN